eukprot:9537792-Lingulodinium_polyedra.AAC.1
MHETQRHRRTTGGGLSTEYDSAERDARSESGVPREEKNLRRVAKDERCALCPSTQESTVHPLPALDPGHGKNAQGFPLPATWPGATTHTSGPLQPHRRSEQRAGRRTGPLLREIQRARVDPTARRKLALSGVGPAPQQD